MWDRCIYGPQGLERVEPCTVFAGSAVLGAPTPFPIPDQGPPASEPHPPPTVRTSLVMEVAHGIPVVLAWHFPPCHGWAQLPACSPTAVLAAIGILGPSMGWSRLLCPPHPRGTGSGHLQGGASACSCPGPWGSCSSRCGKGAQNLSLMLCGHAELCLSPTEVPPAEAGAPGLAGGSEGQDLVPQGCGWWGVRD